MLRLKGTYRPFFLPHLNFTFVLKVPIFIHAVNHTFKKNILDSTMCQTQYYVLLMQQCTKQTWRGPVFMKFIIQFLKGLQSLYRKRPCSAVLSNAETCDYLN